MNRNPSVCPAAGVVRPVRTLPSCRSALPAVVPAAITLMTLMTAGCSDPAWFLDGPLKSMQSDADRLYAQGRFVESAETCQGAIRRRPRDAALEASLHRNAGRAWTAEADRLRAAGRDEDARLPLERAFDHYRSASLLAPERREAFEGAADVLRRMGRGDLADGVLLSRRVPRRPLPDPVRGPETAGARFVPGAADGIESFPHDGSAPAGDATIPAPRPALRR